MGGLDNPENLVELTVEEHANAHKKLWEEKGCWQDYVAWKALTGQIDSDEIRKLIISYTLKGKTKSNEHKKKLSEAAKKRKASPETRKKMSETRKGRKITWDLNANTPELKKQKSEKMKGIPKPKVVCPHCNKSGGAPQMNRWHFDNCKEK
jgi:hypothetical protein